MSTGNRRPARLSVLRLPQNPLTDGYTSPGDRAVTFLLD